MAAVVMILVAVLVLWRPRELAPTPTPSPSSAPVVRRPVTLDVGEGRACRVATDGKVACWGANGSGELGIGIWSSGSSRPVTVAGIDAPVTALSVGGTHTCALTAVGEVWCWGQNFSGQLGDGTEESSAVPVRVQGLGGPAVDVSAGEYHTCAVMQTGGVRCWGYRSDGELGDGRDLPPLEGEGAENPRRPSRSSTPVDVVGLTAGVVAVSAGWSHTCAITVTGGVKCWGSDYSGQLGDGVALVPIEGDRRTSTPVDVVGLTSGVVVVAAGTDHTCALTSAGRVLCWGINVAGQLGDGTRTIAPGEPGSSAEGPLGRSVPAEVVGLTSGVTAIDVGSRSCAVTSEAKVLCWGPTGVEPPTEEPEPESSAGPTTESDSGGTTEPDEGQGLFDVKPVEVAGLPAEVASVSVGPRSTCVTTAQSAVSCWGANGSGQLGDGTSLPRPGPVSLARVSRQLGATRAVKINVIVVDSALDVTRDVPEAGQEAAAAMAHRLTTQDPALLRTIREAFRGATAGVLDPTVQVVTAAQRLESSGSGCLDRRTDEPVQAAARPRQVEAAINVIVVKALICSDTEGETIEGYDSPAPGSLPVVGWIALGNPGALVYDMIHEWGHDAGLLHAGRSDCQDRVALTGCTINEVGDPNSVMSYERTTDAFTVAELHQLGFIREREVVSVRDSTAVEFRVGSGWDVASALLVDRGQPATEGVPSIHEDRVYITGQPGQLEVRFYSLGTQPSSRGTEPPDWSLTTVVWPQPQPGATIYQGSDVTVSYRGSDADGNAILHVTRPHTTTPPATSTASPARAG